MQQQQQQQQQQQEEVVKLKLSNGRNVFNCVCVCREGEPVSQNGLPTEQDSARVSYRSPAYQKYSSSLQGRRPAAP